LIVPKKAVRPVDVDQLLLIPGVVRADEDAYARLGVHARWLDPVQTALRRVHTLRGESATVLGQPLVVTDLVRPSTARSTDVASSSMVELPSELALGYDG
jgi:hypothetical protein